MLSIFEIRSAHRYLILNYQYLILSKCLVIHKVDLSLIQEQELKPCMDNLIISLLSNYRFSPVLEDFIWQVNLFLELTILCRIPEQFFM